VREDQRHVFSHEASADEEERLCGDPIEPLHVVEGADQRCSSPTSASRVSTPNPTRNWLGGGPELRPNAVAEVSLRFWQVLHVVEHRCAQLM